MHSQPYLYQFTTCIDLMTSVDASIKSKSEHIHYNEALAALITIMENQ